MPFSLDGKPPYPKPETEALDAAYTPTEAETAAFARAIAAASAAPVEEAKRLIDEALVPTVERLLQGCGVLAAPEDITAWLATEWQTPGAQETAGSYDTLRDGIALAAGASAPTIGYAIGQLWRKWQDALRVGYNPAQTPTATAQAIVAFDEGLKRYSYGPPIRSSRDLLALADTGLVDLSLAADPEITVNDAGWHLAAGDCSASAGAMIDGVLPSPNLDAVRREPVEGLTDAGLLSSVSDHLAARIAADGQVISAEGRIVPSLSLLGRWGLGSVIAVDSLYDCFGATSHRWAAGVIERLGIATDRGAAGMADTSR